jgi:hypothetical protein
MWIDTEAGRRDYCHVMGRGIRTSRHLQSESLTSRTSGGMGLESTTGGEVWGGLGSFPRHQGPISVDEL